MGRKRCRFIVWHRLPLVLDDPKIVRDWFVAAFPETERLVRESLPTTSRKYPAQLLADELTGLRAYLQSVEV